MHAICRLYSNQSICIYTVPALTRNYMYLTLLFFLYTNNQAKNNNDKRHKAPPTSSTQYRDIHILFSQSFLSPFEACTYPFIVSHTLKLQPISTQFSFNTLSATMWTVKYACKRKTGCKAFRRTDERYLLRDKDVKYF